MPVAEREHEKQSAARNSVLAAAGLVAFKAVVGVTTGSLGILAEAAHSALDLAAAAVTFFAVRASAKPADREHRYGHGKVENLSALFETVLLLVTCAWIIAEALRRIVSGRVHVDVTLWSFLVMGTSIVVDVSRSRMLYRVAKKHRSQALEADALHFATDIWSSAVVVLGLVGVAVADRVGGVAFLRYADVVAALAVAIIVIHVSVKLGRRTIAALLDTAPEGLEERIVERVGAIAGVEDCHNVRVRTSGPEVFVDLHVLLDAAMPLAEAHRLTEVIEAAIQELAPGADVTVHPEPVEVPRERAPR